MDRLAAVPCSRRRLAILAAAVGGAPLLPVAAKHTQLHARFLGTFGSHGTAVGQFGEMGGRIAVAPDGTVYVADPQNDRIQAFAADGTLFAKWGVSGSGNGQFHGPCGVAIAPNGQIYVTDSDNARIQRFSAAAAFLSTWGTAGSAPGQFDQPCGIAVGPDGTVYVADTGNHRIQRFTATGGQLQVWGGQGPNPGQFNRPLDVAVNGDGLVYVADTFNDRVQIFSATGVFQRLLGGGKHTISSPGGMGLAPNGRLYLADFGQSVFRIEAFSAKETLLGRLGRSGSSGKNGVLSNPTDSAVAPDGTVYVMDHDNYRVQFFSVP